MATNYYGNVAAYNPLRIGGWGASNAKPQGRQLENPFADFEKNWYIEKGFGDPTKVVEGTNRVMTQGATTKQVRLPSPTGKGLSPFSKTVTVPAEYQTFKTFKYAGVTEAARNAFLTAFGGQAPTKVSGIANGQGYFYNAGAPIDQIGNVGAVPTLLDPNSGRNQLKIRRM